MFGGLINLFFIFYSVRGGYDDSSHTTSNMEEVAIYSELSRKLNNVFNDVQKNGY